jgi:thiol-disulfide isomerase/thioredoxin
MINGSGIQQRSGKRILVFAMVAMGALFSGACGPAVSSPAEAAPAIPAAKSELAAVAESTAGFIGDAQADSAPATPVKVITVAEVPAASEDRMPVGRQRELLDRIFSQRKLRAPSLDGGVGWINTAGPVDLKDLHGKFVLLDFWTYCCINCMHIMPELKKLEHAYPNNLVVIGVHTAKFEAEQDSQNISDAVLRYELEHPVVNDARQAIWTRYEVSSWPTLVLIDPDGYVIYFHGGETKAEVLDSFLKSAVPYYRGKKLLDERPLRFDLQQYHAVQTPLRFPGKIVADEPGGRLFISDSNHNRIVVTRLDGKLLATIGNGTQGRTDGSFSAAEFNRPQGLALNGEMLYVADTESHLLRKVDLKQQRVVTIAGTGRQADNGWPGLASPEEISGRARLPQRFVGPPRQTPLSSPWDVWVHRKDLYIAMAGTHQIWKMPLTESEIGPFAGNSREDIVDGPLLPRQPFGTGFASFAQPSGLASDGRSLFVVDSEGASLRAVPLLAGANSEVSTIIGTADLPTSRLFTFGDVDGAGQRVRFQHPLGLAFHGGMIYLCDTYNNKIKLIDPEQHSAKTFAGTGSAGHNDAPGKPGTAATFNEPCGLAYAAGKLYVTDTNNHLIRTIALDGNHQVGTLTIDGLAPPAPPQPPAESRPNFKGAGQVTLPPVNVKPTDGAVHLAVRLELPSGYKINPLAPMRYWVEAQRTAGPLDRSTFGKLQKLEHPAAKFDIRLPVKESAGSETVTLSMNYYYCQEGESGLCKMGSVVWTIPLQLTPDAANDTAPVSLTVKD